MSRSHSRKKVSAHSGRVTGAGVCQWDSPVGGGSRLRLWWHWSPYSFHFSNKKSITWAEGALGWETDQKDGQDRQPSVLLCRAGSPPCGCGVHSTHQAQQQQQQQVGAVGLRERHSSGWPPPTSGGGCTSWSLGVCTPLLRLERSRTVESGESL